MNDEDKKLIEEAEQLGGSEDASELILEAIELLPKLAKRLREALNVPDVPPEPAKLPEPLVDGYYWVRSGPAFKIAEHLSQRWWVICDDNSYADDYVEVILGPLQPPTVTNVTK